MTEKGTKTIKRNPSFTPSPKLTQYLSESSEGVTQTLNELFDRYSMIIGLDAVRLTPKAQEALRELLLGVFIDNIAIQAVSQDVIETGNSELIEKLSDATFGQVLATLVRYKIIDKVISEGG